MADGAVRIRSQLERHTTNGFTAAGTVLQGTNFQIPPKITPEDLDWEGSRPLKPWLVRRGAFSLPGYWNLEWIEVCMADVTNVFCRVGKQDETTLATSTSRPALESEGPLVQDRPPGENQQRLRQHAVAGRAHRNLSRLRTP
jgi:hypothetical protein